MLYVPDVIFAPDCPPIQMFSTPVTLLPALYPRAVLRLAVVT